MGHEGVIAVVGATGRQGGAVVRHLLADGWRVRALTRDPESDRSRGLEARGAEVMVCEMERPDTLVHAFAGAYGVFSVQNPMIAGFEGEVRQGKNVADAAKATGVRHLVYGGAGPGTRGTGVESWESKLIVADHARRLDVPLTVLRPMAFMELMTDKAFYPAVSAWHLMPKLAGADTRIPWLAVDDLGAIAARAFADPDTFIGADLPLAAEFCSLNQCQQLWRRSTGHRPRSFPMPVRLFERFVGKDLTTMWRWLRENDVPVDPAQTRDLLPGAASVEQWLTTR